MMDLGFKVFAMVSRPANEVFEAVADPDQLSRYFTTGGARGWLLPGATVLWEFAEVPGAFPVDVVEAARNEKIVLRWKANDPSAPEEYQTTVTMTFTPVEDQPTRTRVEISETGWRESEDGLTASYGNCMGWSQMLVALKAWLEHGINLREGMYA
jgi:uncharacterized protein YndB with AHSA1/START domain